MDRANVGKTVARRTGIVSIMTVVSRSTGLIRDIVIASYFGAGFATDAFLIALSVPLLLSRNLAEGSFAPAFVPVLTDELAESDDAARRAIRSAAGFVLVLTSVFVIIGVVFSTSLTHLIAPGFTEHPGKSELAAALLRILLPYLVLASMVALANNVLNTLSAFALPAAAQAIHNGVLILCLVAGLHFVRAPIYLLAWGTLVGQLSALLPLIYLLGKRGFPMRLGSPFGSPVVMRLTTLALPALWSTSLLQLMVFFNRVFASLLSEGSVSWYYFADRVVQFPLGVLTMAVATAILPTFSKFATTGDDALLGRLLTQSLAWLSFVTLPATAGLVVLAQPIASAVYQRGSFTADDAAATAGALVCFSVGLWPISCHVVLVRAFLSKKNMRAPFGVAVITIIVNMVLAVCLMGPPALAPTGGFSSFLSQLQASVGFADMDHRGLALASSMASFVNFLLLFLLLPVISLQVERRSWAVSLGRSVLASLVMAMALRLMLTLELSSLKAVVIGIPLGVFVFLVAALALRSPEAIAAVRVVRRVYK